MALHRGKYQQLEFQVSGTAGNITLWSAENSITGNNNLSWDNINNRLGNCSNTPSATLDVTGNIRITDGTQANGKSAHHLTRTVCQLANYSCILSGSGSVAQEILVFWAGANRRI